MSTRRCEHPEQTPALPRRRQPIAFLAALWWTLLAGLAAPALAGADFEPRAGIAVETTLPVFDRINGQYAVYANLRNDSPEPLTGPTRLVVAQSSLAVRNAQGTTAAGEPYFTISNAQNFRLAPGARTGRLRIGFELMRRNLTHSFRVETLAPNRAPVAHAGPDQTPRVGDTITLDAGVSSDADGDPLTYLWSIDQAPSGSTATLGDPEALRPTLTIDKPGRYAFGLVVDDGTATSVPDQCIADTRNSAPVANAGPDQSAYVDDILTLDGSASSDVDGDPLTYAWTPAALPAGSGAALSDPTSAQPWFRVDRPGDYRFDLAVSDGAAGSPADPVRVSTLNSAPTANAGPDQTAHVNDVVILDGAASSDPDLDPLSHLWSLTSAPPGSSAALDDPALIRPRVTIDLPGAYVGTLIVNDGEYASDPDTVTISTINSRPSAHAGADQTIITGETLTLDGSGSQDPDLDPLSFDWSLLSKPAQSGTALVAPASPAPSLTPDRDGDYIVQLIVSDGALASAPDTATVTAATPPPPNRAPEVGSVPPATATVGHPYSYAVTASDPDLDPLTYSLPVGPAGMGIGPVSGLIEWTPTEADLAASPVAVTVQVTDGRGGSDTQGFAITVQPAVVQPLVPTLIGQTKAAAMAQIADAKLGLGALTYQHDALHPDGQVTAQTPAPGTRVDLGTPVALSVSLGPDQGRPPNPETVAPPLDPTVTTQFGDATDFLYSGDNPVQTGVAAGSIEEKRAAVIRGKVLDRANDPLPGVAVTVLDHPELGQTLSRADGAFDLVVNGGGVITLVYQKAGYLPAQRQVQAPWQDYAFAPDVALITLDPVVTAIDLSAPTGIQVARGSPSTDGDGTRQATLLVPPDTTAAMVLPDGSTQPLASLLVRVTEYTLGPDGPLAMPAKLPPTSGYTYAVEISADEAIAAGATSVALSRPVPYYVENFLGFPIGSPVPVGYYDRVKGRWIAAPNGRVIKVIGIANGSANLDIDGDGASDTSAALVALGIDDAERAKLAELYSPGQSLWRVPLDHFTPWDCNWPYGPPPGAQPPTDSGAQPDDPDLKDDPCEEAGSIIGCEPQTLGEAVPITGTPFILHYQSQRTPGYGTGRTLNVNLTGAVVPPGVKRVKLTVSVAGKRSEQTFAATPNQRRAYTWDGLDSFGRAVQGWQKARVTVSYLYDAVYYAARADLERSFALASGIPTAITRQGAEIGLEQTSTLDLRAGGPDGEAVAGWSLSAHQRWDASRGVLVRGDGGETRAGAFGAVIATVAGAGAGGPAGAVGLRYPARVALAPNGDLYIADTDRDRVLRVAPGGIVATVAGTGIRGFAGDGGPATAARLRQPIGIALASDGSLYIADWANHRVRQVTPDGVIATVAGTDLAGYSGDGGPATAAHLAYPQGLALAPDGSLYIADAANNRIRRVSPEGIIATVAGDGTRGFIGDGGPGTAARLAAPADVAIAPDGSLYIADTYNQRIRRLAPDGTLATVAGTGEIGFSGDGGPATAALLAYPHGVAVGRSGVLYIADEHNHRIRRVLPDGTIVSVAGRRPASTLGDGGPATVAQLAYPYGVAVAPDGSLYIADYYHHRIRRVGPGSASRALLVPSHDGGEAYEFDLSGRHLRTLDPLTKATLYTFAYDPQGRLMSLADASGNLTRIEHNGAGEPTAIVGPYGQRTELILDATGYLAIIANPAGETWRMAYTATGLLTRFEDPRGYASTMTYDTAGRLVRDADAAGGRKDLSRTALADPPGSEVALTTAEGRITTYRVEDLPTGPQRRTRIAPDGTQSVAVTGSDGTTTNTAPDGTVATTVEGPDPRFGMSSPLVASQTLATPGGLVSTLTHTRAATLADPDDPLSLTRLTDIIKINGRTTTSVYTAATRTTARTSPAGRVTTSQIDALGRPILAQTPGLEPIAYGYDGHGRLETLTQASGPETRTLAFAYDADGNLASLTDALGRSTALAYDPAGRVTAQTLPDTREIRFDYDPNGNLTALTPPGRPVHGFDYTPVDLTETYTPPDLGTGPTDTLYSYNRDRQLTRVLRPDGKSTDLDYDAAGRLATLGVPEGAFRYSYHPTTGRLTQIAAPDGGTLGFSYDGSLLTQATWTGAVAGGVGFGYDSDLRLASVSLNGADPIAYAYDPDGLLTQAGALSLTRDAKNGLLKGTALGTVTDTRTYNGFGEPATYSAQGATPLLDIAYTRDALGRIVAKSETIGGETTSYVYGYDLAGRLVEVHRDGAIQTTWDYEPNGNRTHMNGAEIAHYDDQDRLLDYLGTAYSYTANGELATKTQGAQITRYAYDVLGNLRQVTLPNSPVIDYLTDGRSRRMGKKVNGILIQGFLYQDQLKPVAELDGAGQVVSRFVYATRVNVPDYMVKGSATYRILTDHLGSPRLVVDADSGAIPQRMDYDAWGRVLLDTNPGFQPFGFAGGLYDRDTGLVRFGARDYDPEVGRWVAKDPIGFRGKDANLYRYVEGDPISRVDPTGKFFFVPALVGAASAGEGGTILGGSALLVGAAIWMAGDLPPGFWPGDTGSEEWGRRNGCGPKEGRRRFHQGVKQGDNISGARDKYGVDPSTGDVIDPEGEVIGNLDDE